MLDQRLEQKSDFRLDSVGKKIQERLLRDYVLTLNKVRVCETLAVQASALVSNTSYTDTFKTNSRNPIRKGRS